MQDCKKGRDDGNGERVVERIRKEKSLKSPVHLLFLMLEGPEGQEGASEFIRKNKRRNKTVLEHNPYRTADPEKGSNLSSGGGGQGEKIPRAG